MRQSETAMRGKKKRMLPVIGWREWVSLPDLGVDLIKAKVDTGARTSAIHAWHIEKFVMDGAPWVRFELHPLQDDNHTVVPCEAPVLSKKDIRNSGGTVQERYVISTALRAGDYLWPIELSLTNRDEMGFRLLLGRSAVRRRFLVDPSRSFLIGGKPAAHRTGGRTAKEGVDCG